MKFQHLKVISEKITKSNNKMLGPFTDVWNQLESVEFDEKEYKFNLENLKGVSPKNNCSE